MPPISLRALKAQQRQRQSLWTRHNIWLRANFSPAARVVIVVGEITIAYTLFVIGLAIGIII